MAKFWQRLVEILDAINGWTEDIHRDKGIGNSVPPLMYEKILRSLYP